MPLRRVILFYSAFYCFGAFPSVSRAEHVLVACVGDFGHSGRFEDNVSGLLDDLAVQQILELVDRHQKQQGHNRQFQRDC